uniref:Uncharacterized protein n=1 Tax=Pithovirus LCPAC101 TaxID=2506586 RepID=A0A481Z406_9VIRU|nr:MAG: hypothetical protein LCPAC101_00020 [Pithovirus LCPAC101]
MTNIESDDSGRYNIDYKFLDSDNLVRYVKNSNTNKDSLTTKFKELIGATDEIINSASPNINSVSIKIKGNDLILSYNLK